ncbi:thioredoxin domain-containing protein [Aestuariibaculum sediminum]|uniref:Thioredoxin domain-containing protein n=1 Tax=Aestuariibaculum sediminum TaxID=2770637 RepID=A0A8J6U8T1_9FLAO|nr:thioredoxin domain-containing protein [Aestuariibaculum sediminum]MBD0833413.1 thioredoxin domain-containing protein [Aestuariibaculum sediminum]
MPTFLYIKNILLRTVFILLAFMLFSCKDNKKGHAKETAFTNNLIYETSPYLLQHAHNPVNWNAWGDDALALAKAENKLLVISIGYSTCHWCHVMEEESFQNDTVAQVMNQDFINIKVDREERPDVDHVYMTAAQMMNGAAGWPLNVIALPDGRPVFIATYMEKEQWMALLKKFQAYFKSEPDKLYEYAKQVEEGLQALTPIVDTEADVNFSIENLNQALAAWKTNWDTEWGGDKANEKFMLPVRLQFLLKYAVMFSDDDTYAHVVKTLNKMALGGVYDHLEGGFFRYTTDSKWQVPHFEKMLYDNAQLIALYANAYKASKNPDYKKIVYETFSFLQNNMFSGQGGYYAAIDADSQGEEGKYYLWKANELQEILGNTTDTFNLVYNPQKIQLEYQGFVLQPIVSDTTIAEQLKVSLKTLQTYKEDWKNALLKAREKRVKPLTDKKIICSWNALLGSGYIEAYMAFQDKTFLDRAYGIYDFLQKHLIKEGRLYHSYISDQSGEKGFLEDYAFYIEFLIQIYKATANEAYLNEAKLWLERTDTLFYDEEKGLYQFASGNELITPVIKLDDGVLPSPNTIMAKNLMQLGHIYFNKDFKKRSKTMLSAVQQDVLEYLPYYSGWADGFLDLSTVAYEVAIVGQEAKLILSQMNQAYLPNTLIVASREASPIPIFENRFSDSGTYIYICQENMCKLPTTNANQAINQIKQDYE